MTSRSRFAESTAGDQPLERDGFVVCVPIAGEPRVDRNQAVDAADFDAVTGVVDHRHLGPIGDSFEIADGALEIEIADVEQRGRRSSNRRRGTSWRLMSHRCDGLGSCGTVW